MRTPVRLAPPDAERWMSRARRLRWWDFGAAALLVWPFAAVAIDGSAIMSLAAAVAVVAVAACAQGIRARWRPVSAVVSLSVSRDLRPGDRAWLVFPDHVEGVIVTARRRLRLVVAHPDQGPAEGVEVRRTRVPVVPVSR